ncbi:IS5 family transposase [Nordella sp. HKS 07]|uniref:IS5 family transposase n=1 Tax=Nordella sp. HKS 07 TaxID=2712222 RepID=UPI00352C3B07
MGCAERHGIECTVTEIPNGMVLNALSPKYRTGSPWADIPERCGPYTTCYNRFVRWRKAGVWDQPFDAVSRAYDGDMQMIDSSSIRVHQHGANGKKGARRIPPPGREPDDRCMGRSRGGLTTKIHALVDARGLPIALKLTPGQAHDGRSAAGMRDTLGGGDVLLADRAHDSDALRLEMAARGAWANIKPMPGRKRRPPFSAFLYRYRNLVECFFGKLKHFRAVATRFEKYSENYLALVKLASAKIWMRFTSR